MEPVLIRGVFPAHSHQRRAYLIRCHFQMMRPLYPGQFHHIKLNLLNVVLVLDLSQLSSLNFVANVVSNIINRGFPFRFGVVPMVESEDGEAADC